MNSTDWSYNLKDHEMQQLVRDAGAPFIEKLRWLEQAHKIVLEMEDRKKLPARNMTVCRTIE